MGTDIGHRADGGLGPLGADTVVLPPHGNFLQRLQTGVKEERSVVEQPPPRRTLGAAGDFLFPDGDVAGPVFPCGDADAVQRLQNGRQASAVVHTSLLPGDAGVVDVAQIMIHRSASGDPPENRDSHPPESRRPYFPADVLIAPHHHAGRVAPEQEDILLPEAGKNKFLKGQVVVWVRRMAVKGNHPGAPPPAGIATVYGPAKKKSTPGPSPALTTIGLV